jgi:hypothetical protein
VNHLRLIEGGWEHPGAAHSRNTEGMTADEFNAYFDAQPDDAITDLFAWQDANYVPTAEDLALRRQQHNDYLIERQRRSQADISFLGGAR